MTRPSESRLMYDWAGEGPYRAERPTGVMLDGPAVRVGRLSGVG